MRRNGSSGVDPMMRSLFGGRRRSNFHAGWELGAYRNDLIERTQNEQVLRESEAVARG